MSQAVLHYNYVYTYLLLRNDAYIPPLVVQRTARGQPTQHCFCVIDYENIVDWPEFVQSMPCGRRHYRRACC